MLETIMTIAGIVLFLLAGLFLLGAGIGFVNPAAVSAKSRVGAFLPSFFVAVVCAVLASLLMPESEPLRQVPAAQAEPEPPAQAIPPPAIPVVSSNQWIFESALAASGGESGRLRIAIGCRAQDRLVVIGLADGDGFANGSVSARWDDGANTTYNFRVSDETLIATAGNDLRIRVLIDRLRERNSVELQVTAAEGEEVTDRVSLSGSSDAINSLSCVRPIARRPPPTSQRRTGSVSMAQATVNRVQGDLDSPLERILAQMPDDVVPALRQSGQDRIFTYTFADGSQLILTFRPGAPGEGLFLYTADVR